MNHRSSHVFSLFLKEKGSAKGKESLFNRAVSSSQNTPLFLKEKGSARGKENFFSREKKLSFPLASSPFTLI